MNRTEIDQRLDAVAARVPRMRDEYPDREELLLALAGELDVIEDGAVDTSDARYASRRIDGILAAAGVAA